MESTAQAIITGPRVTLRPTVETDLADYERWQDPGLPAHRLGGPWFKNAGWVVVYHRPDDEHTTEALALWADQLFRTRGLSRIGLATWSGNHGMLRVAGKLGFALEGRIREACEVEGRFYDRLRYGLLRREWEAARAGWPLAGS